MFPSSTLKLIIHAITPMCHRKEKNTIHDREPKEEGLEKVVVISLALRVPKPDKQVSKHEQDTRGSGF